MSANPPELTGPPTQGQVSGLTGRVHGGQQPIAGSTIQLWQVGTTGYGVSPTQLGPSATTVGDGSFSIDSSCASAAAGTNTLVYITATGGNPGLAAGTNNKALAMMSALGTCGSLATLKFVSINEVSTIASVYALSQFMSSTGAVGSFGSSNQGLTNAFATVNNLVDIGTGTARVKTPSGNGLVPQAEINTLADILAPCVNSSGPTSSGCSMLIATVSAVGGAPSTTLGATLAIARNPGFNVNQLLALTTPTSPFQPTVTLVNDWTLALGFSSAGTNPVGLAIDGMGNVWVANRGSGGATSSVSMITPSGVPAANSPFSSPTLVNGISALAIDQSNNVWLANSDANSAAELNATSAAGAYSIHSVSGPYSGKGISTPTSVAIDSAANIWFVDSGSNSLTELNHANYAGTASNYSNIGLSGPRNIAFDNSGNAWVSNSGSGTVAKVNIGTSSATGAALPIGGLTAPAGVAIDGYSNVWLTDLSLSGVAELNHGGGQMSPGGGFSGGGITGSSADAIDGSGNLWVADTNGNRLSEFSPAGTALSPLGGYLGGSLFSPVSVALDASGNVWLANGNPVMSGGLISNVTEFVGLAVPVIMPLSQAVKQGQLGQEPGSPASTSSLLANAGGPYTGTTGQAIAFDGSKSTGPAGQTLTYGWTFGDGTTAAGVKPTHIYSSAGSFTASLTITGLNGATATANTSVTEAIAPAPVISAFSPATGPIGTIVTLSGSNLIGPNNTVPQVLLAQQGGTTLNAPVSASSATSLSFVIPPGAATGKIALTVGTQSVSSSASFTVTTTSSFTVAVTPGTGTLVQGQSAALAVTVNSANGFSGLAALAVSGLPSGITGTFQPASIAVGQVAVLSLSAPASQAVGTTPLTITAVAAIDGQTVSPTTTASLKVVGVSTSFTGRTVVDDAQNTPIGGVTIKFVGTDDKGNKTGCAGQTLSDGAGNFLLSGLPAACIGPQLMSYDGTTATSPAGKYAGVNLSYTLVSGQLVSSPVLVHLPRIDNAETVQVQQNATTDQVFTFSSIPGLQVTVYAGTTIVLDDGSKPNPFPLTAMDIPLDRLPEQVATNGMLMNFVVAFQPANATASQPVAVTFPNPLNMPAGMAATLTTLDPTRGYMVPYGTTTVANDGRTFIPDLDPSHPGHRYGLVHFDWHTPLTTLAPQTNLSSDCPKCQTPMPIDLSTGIETYTTTDIQIRGGRGSIGIQRTYRSLDKNPGPFGIGTGFNYSYALNVLGYTKGQALITLIMPNGNQYPLSLAPDGTFLNGTVPALRGSVVTPNQSAGIYTLRQLDGTLYTFTVFPSQGIGGAYLTSITDLNGNTTTITLNPAQPLQVSMVTDPVGRSLTLTYDGANRVMQITDPIGRAVKYMYNQQGTLQSFTDANGGITQYGYDSGNNLATITDARGVVTETNTYNESGDGRVTQQVDANGGVTKFTYTLLNQIVADLSITTAAGMSPVLQTVLTDPLGHQTTYRFNPAGFLQSATDPNGQTTTLIHDPAHNNLVTAYQGAGVCVVCGDRTKGNTSFTYDQFGNRLTQTDAKGHTTTYTYDLRFNKVNSITDPLGDVTRLGYDGNGNLLSITDANGHQTQLAYDNFGEVTQVTDAVGAKTSVGYDSFGNITSVTDALGHATSLSYDAASRLTQVSDALGRISTATYDPLDRVKSQTDPRGSTTSFAYDPIGNLLSYTDARKNTVQFKYDPIGRLHTRISQLLATEDYEYDANSNLQQYTDRRGLASKFQYDANNRLVQETYSDATVARTYDPNGRLLTVEDSQGGEFGFTYDPTGGLLTQSEPTGEVQYTRDFLERVKTRQVVGQAAVSYTYDPVGAMKSATTAAAGVSYIYDERNLPKILTRTNGVATNYSYDQLGQVLSIIHAKGAVPLNTQTYTYDAVGNRSAISNDISQPLITQSTTATVDNANELITNGDTTYKYDANGNRVLLSHEDNTVAYEWDGRNRLSSIINNSGAHIDLKYDFGRNLLQSSSIEGASIMQRRTVVDSTMNVVSITSSLGGPTFILTGRSINSNFASIDIDGNVLYGLGNAQGSTVGTSDGSAQLISKASYDPYGEGTGSASTAYPFGFIGSTSIAGNIDYFRSRYYDSSIGRFLSEDPIGIAGGVNQFSYAEDNPLTLSDQTGLDPNYDLNDAFNDMNLVIDPSTNEVKPDCMGQAPNANCLVSEEPQASVSDPCAAEKIGKFLFDVGLALLPIPYLGEGELVIGATGYAAYAGGKLIGKGAEYLLERYAEKKVSAAGIKALGKAAEGASGSIIDQSTESPKCGCPNE